ncbi:MAG: ABC-ATPase domain-containing protein [Lachnospiraceae bacterium]|nr:ABC-ATPase domain-containing protein [Lachnospiraceae bacterium]
MKTKQNLKTDLQLIHKKSYPAYKSIAGAYDFGLFVLSIDHVQGDPFAAPSHLTIQLPRTKAQFPETYLQNEVMKTALEDYLLRQFASQAARYSHQAKGSGKSGVITLTRPGQEVLKRSSCTIDSRNINIRFFVGFPANGRTINSIELSKILLDYIPACVEQALLYVNLSAKEVEQAVFLAEDQEAIRKLLKEKNLAAFVADSSILPRESGLSQRPMKNAIPFESPESLRITLTLPHKGTITGMGIHQGITLIAGGGYHGKSTLLQALERGVYNHISGDGREYVITDSSALKLRAEDGRRITNVDISLFIRNLPDNKDTKSFSTLDASGSTSQAANIMEGIEAESQLLLIDEDTSATNFMVRDELMQRVIARDKEPITPFLERARDLYEQANISTILVVGSCGSYFYIADTILQMDNYRPLDITSEVKQVIQNYPAPAITAPDFHLPKPKRQFVLGSSQRQRKNYRGTGTVTERLKVKTSGKDGFSLGNESVSLRYVEQLVDEEQTAMLAQLTRLALENFSNRTISLSELVSFLTSQLDKNGFGAVCGRSYISGRLAMPRLQEIYACLNRFPF